MAVSFLNKATMPNTSSPITVNYVVIGGGGGGSNDAFNSGAGGRSGGGGGAGGYRSSVTGELSGGGAAAETPLSLYANQTYPVFIGAGGTGAAASTTVNGVGTNGSPTQFAFINSLGGGRGGCDGSSSFATYPLSGGSGGGGAYDGIPKIPGPGTANQGFSGSAGFPSGNYTGGGGGGAGSVGGVATSTVAAAGGDGVSSSITGTAVIRAGGGPGCRGDNDTVGSSQGGAGSTIGANGTANTGGGGAAGDNASGGGGDGGSGVVILSYPSNYTITIGAGLTGTTATVGANNVTTFTAGTGTVSFA